jgi:hypothetical protein
MNNAAATSTLLGLLVLTPMFAGCQPGAQQVSETTSLVRFKSKTNVASFFMGNMDGIPGVAQDPPNMRNALGSTDFNFAIRSQGRVQTAGEIISEAGKAAADTGYDGGTYFFYFTGHGAEDGSLSSGDRQFMWSEVADAIRAARKDPETGKTRALSRGIIFADACFSGNLVDGNGAVTTALRLAPGASVGVASLPDLPVDFDSVTKYRAALDAFANQVVETKEGVFDELIVIASSTKLETSGDMQTGGVGTTAFIAALNAAKANPAMKLREFLGQIQGGAPGQTPVFKTVPESLLDETVVGDDQSGPAASGNEPPKDL